MSLKKEMQEVINWIGLEAPKGLKKKELISWCKQCIHCGYWEIIAKYLDTSDSFKEAFSDCINWKFYESVKLANKKERGNTNGNRMGCC